MFDRDRPREEPHSGRNNTPTNGKGGRKRSRMWWIVGALLLALIIVPSALSEMITDWMWFGSQNLADVYTTRLWLGLGVFVGGFLLAAIFCWINWSVAWRITRPGTLYSGQQTPFPAGLARALIIIAALVIGLFMGLAAADQWATILLYLNSVPFGQTDPVFNNDIGFYVFGMPFYGLVRGWTLGLLIVAAIGAAVIYLIGMLPQINRQINEAGSGKRGSKPAPFSFTLDRRINTHLSILGAIFLALVAVGYWLSRFDLLYSTRPVAYGAGYTDVNARLPALNIMMVVAGLTALILLINIRMKAWKVLAGALGVWLVALILVGGVYPWFVQQFVVKPSEFSLEKPFIQNNITATRAAFGLDKFKEREVPAVTSVTQAQIAQNQTTVQNIRLWDYRPLLSTYSQLQQFKNYYSFDGVDIDRYTIGGTPRQVMLSARELSVDAPGVPDQVRTWQNAHFVYTHGYGAVVSPVNEIVGEGLPKLLVKDVPPVSEVPELNITRPEIYYGEQANQYLFVNSNTQEFDYPVGNDNKFTKYAGKGGVPLSDYFTKLLFALRLGDGNILLSDYITPQTRVLFHRNIYDSIRLLAPFLKYDADPYLVISNGKLYWMQDAYTYTDRYPYSTPSAEGYNYIRNSVKVVVDAYDGSTTFYVADSADPLVKAYRGIFPALFRDISAMPAGLRAHVRYPEDLMNVQAQMYETFHMTDPQVFYTKEDVWNVPFGTQSANNEALQAYYTIMQLPGETSEQFMLILPLTPATRDNMIAWMAAKSDGANYGEVDVIRYPKQELVYGPNQIEARIDQDPTISSQVTLWNQSGSTVTRGNLLTIPISNTLLYVEPLFLQSTSIRFPELKRVIVATANNVGFGSNLAEALNVAFNVAPAPVLEGGGAAQPPGGTPVPGQTAVAGATPLISTAADLTASARNHYDRAQQALKAGDWTTYGQELDAMKANLDALAALVGVPTPAVTPGATPGATPASSVP